MPAGDSDSFISAVETANLASGSTVIRLEAGVPYEFNLRQHAPEPIIGDIVLRGDGAEFIGAGNESFGQLFEIGEQGSLDMSDIVIRDFTSEEVSDRGLVFNAGMLIAQDVRFERISSRIGPRDATGGYFGALIVNHGELQMDRVQISNVTLKTPDRIWLAVIALENYGVARLGNIFISDSKALESPLARPHGVYIAANYAFTDQGLGAVAVRFSTFVGNSDDLNAPSDVRAFSQHCIRPGLCASVGTTASMFVGLPCPFDGSGRSGGFNLVSDGRCDAPRNSDLIGVSPGTVKFERAATGGTRMILPPFSPALDRVREAQVTCPARDATRHQRRVDGNNDGVARCDIGAFENPSGRTVLNGGENGLYHSAGSDGHYVTIEEVRPREYVIFWNTFDLHGEQAWILAVGDRQDDSIVADAFFQPEGMLVPGAGAVVETSALQSWGTITVNPEDCRSGTFTYHSELSQFGSGSFPLDRLSVIEGIGCRD